MDYCYYTDFFSAYKLLLRHLLNQKAILLALLLALYSKTPWQPDHDLTLPQPLRTLQRRRHKRQGLQHHKMMYKALQIPHLFCRLWKSLMRQRGQRKTDFRAILIRIYPHCLILLQAYRQCSEGDIDHLLISREGLCIITLSLFAGILHDLPGRPNLWTQLKEDDGANLQTKKQHQLDFEPHHHFQQMKSNNLI